MIVKIKCSLSDLSYNRIMWAKIPVVLEMKTFFRESFPLWYLNGVGIHSVLSLTPASIILVGGVAVLPGRHDHTKLILSSLETNAGNTECSGHVVLICYSDFMKHIHFHYVHRIMLLALIFSFC